MSHPRVIKHCFSVKLPGSRLASKLVKVSSKKLLKRLSKRPKCVFFSTCIPCIRTQKCQHPTPQPSNGSFPLLLVCCFVVTTRHAGQELTGSTGVLDYFSESLATNEHWFKNVTSMKFCTSRPVIHEYPAPSSSSQTALRRPLD